MKGQRLLRVGGELKKELSNLLNFELPEYRGKFITVTEVRVTKDLQFADAWVSVMGDQPHRKAIMAELINDSHRIRKALAGRVYLRHLPEVRFHLDSSLDLAEKIDNLIKGAPGSEN